MHLQALRWIVLALAGLPCEDVVEVGSRIVDESQRPLAPRDWVPHGSWVGVDLEPGYNVDVVADALHWSPPRGPTLVLCAEVLEHTPHARALVQRMATWPRPGGALVITAAAPGRPPHSGRHAGSPDPGEYYRPVAPAELLAWYLEGGRPYAYLGLAEEREHCDVYFFARFGEVA